MTDIINKATTSDMTPFEKWTPVGDYLTEPGRFKYVPVHGNYLVSLAAEPNTPFFVSYRCGFLHTSPAALCDFAKLIEGLMIFTIAMVIIREALRNEVSAGIMWLNLR
ncbi:MAG: hypothetical protein ACLTER_10990 [Ruminococcus sp.]